MTRTRPVVQSDASVEPSAGAPRSAGETVCACNDHAVDTNAAATAAALVTTRCRLRKTLNVQFPVELAAVHDAWHSVPLERRQGS